PKSSTSAPPVASKREPGGEEREVGQVDDRSHLPAVEILLSGPVGDERDTGLGRGDPVDPRIAHHDRVARIARPLSPLAEVLQDHPPSVGIGFERDRKSTRLNSSHVSISYAVFCLKKKKIKSPMHITQQQ